MIQLSLYLFLLPILTIKDFVQTVIMVVSIRRLQIYIITISLG